MENQIESFISNCRISGAGVEALPSEKIVDLLNQLFNISKSESIVLEKVPEYIKQNLEGETKTRRTNQRSGSCIIQSKNVSYRSN